MKPIGATSNVAAASGPGEPITTRTGEAELPATGEELASPLRIIEIPTKELLAGDPRYNVVIRPFDLVNVPPGPVGEYYVMGNITRAGAYELTGRRLTVKEAIASSGGFGPLAWPSRARPRTRRWGWAPSQCSTRSWVASASSSAARWWRRRQLFMRRRLRWSTRRRPRCTFRLPWSMPRRLRCTCRRRG